MMLCVCCPHENNHTFRLIVVDRRLTREIFMHYSNLRNQLFTVWTDY